MSRHNWVAHAKAHKATTGSLHRSLALRAKRRQPQLTSYQVARRDANEARRLEAARSLAASESIVEQLPLVPDYRHAAELMRARIAEFCGPLMPLGRRGGTA